MDVGKERLSLGSLALIKRCSRTKEPGISHRVGEAFNDIFLLFFATSTAVVLHKHTHTHTEGFSSASLFVANGGGGKKRGRANCGGCANSMRCIFNPNARFFSSFQCLNSSACHTPFSFRRPALHMQTFMMTLKRGRWAVGVEGGGAAVVRTKVARSPPSFCFHHGGMCVCVECRPHNGMSDEALSRHNYFFFSQQSK